MDRRTLVVLLPALAGAACGPETSRPNRRSAGASASIAVTTTGGTGPTAVSSPLRGSLSAPLFLIRERAPSVPEEEGEPAAPLPFRDRAADIAAQPLAKRDFDLGQSLVTPPRLLAKFTGQGKALAGYTSVGTPSDSNGDVGAHDYVQAVNSSFVVLDKKTGAVRFGPADLNLPFQGFTGAEGLCATSRAGDPIVRYDRHADRWFLSQLTRVGLISYSHYECIAISKTGDPTGEWYQYAFGPYTYNGESAFNDYPKLGIWPDGYYLTYNMFAESSPGFVGGRVVVLERSQMLAGLPARQMEFQLSRAHGGLLPGDWDGPFFPPPGSPNLILSDSDAGVGGAQQGYVLQLWRVHVDWMDPGRSTITSIPGNCAPGFPEPCPELVAVSPFKFPCNDLCPNPPCPPYLSSWNCVPQADTTTRLDTIGDRLMYRLPYRNFPGSHESILATRAVDTGSNGPVAVRWYELQNPYNDSLAHGQRLVQQSTYAPPDGRSRWMMSAAQDHMGNMAMGMSESSPDIHPEIWITGRQFDDPPNTLPDGEQLVIQGTISEAERPGRWGDYSMMAIDPEDDCSFYYTQQYFNAPNVHHNDFDTEIAKFKFDNCIADEDRYQIDLSPAATVGETTLLRLSKLRSDNSVDLDYSGTADLHCDDPLAQLPATASFSAGTTGDIAVAFARSGHRTIWASDQSTPTIAGSGNTLVAGAPAMSFDTFGPFNGHLRSGIAAVVQIAARDYLGNLASSYHGTAIISCSDPQASCPASGVFENGVLDLAMTLNTLGPSSVTIVDDTDPTLTVTLSVVVDPMQFIFLNVPSTVTAGLEFGFEVQAVDYRYQLARTFSGEDSRSILTSTDRKAVLPAEVRFNSGVAQNVRVTLKTVGAQFLILTSAQDPALRGSTDDSCGSPPRCDPLVNPAATASFQLQQVLPGASPFPPPVAEENDSQLTNIRCLTIDEFGNHTSAFNGTVHFSTSAAGDVVPGDLLMRNGLLTGLSFAFHGDGARTLTVVNVENPSVIASQPFYVYAHQYLFQNFTTSECRPYPMDVSAANSDGTVDRTYDGLVAIPSSSDPLAVFRPPTLTFSSGAASFLVILGTPGSQTVTLTDAQASGLTRTVVATVNRVSAASTTEAGLLGQGNHLTPTPARAPRRSCLDPF